MGYLPPIKTSSAIEYSLRHCSRFMAFRFKDGERRGFSADSWDGVMPGAWPVVSIFYIFIPMIFEYLWKSTAAVVFSSLLDVFFRGTIGIIYQTYIHKIWIAVWFSENLLTKFDIVWSYFEPFYFRQSGNWRVPQGRSQGSMTDQGGDTITHTQVLNCRCRVCTWFVTGLYPVTNPK